jgi:hypothetical protein
MHKFLRYLMIFCIITPFCLSDAADPKISDFRPLSYKTFGLNTSLELSHFYYQSNFINFDVAFSPYYRIYSDTTELNAALYLWFRHDDPYADISVRPSLSVSHYPMKFPLFLTGSVNMSIYYRRYLSAYEPEWERYIDGDVEIGVGVGHLREGKYVALALHINDILKKEDIIIDDLSEETIKKISQTIANENFYVLKHDRYLKCLFEELERIIYLDPACNDKVIPTFTWFKIAEIAKGHAFYSYVPSVYSWQWLYGYLRQYPSNIYWQRLFGSRFSIAFVASEIRDRDTTDPRITFPLTSSYDYQPQLLVTYEYEHPKDLKNQISLLAFYKIDFYDTNYYHEMRFSYSHGYGIIDFLLIRGLVSIGVNASKDLKSRRAFVISPIGQVNYYLEDHIVLDLEGGMDFIFEKNATQTNYADSYQWFFDLGIDWRIF